MSRFGIRKKLKAALTGSKPVEYVNYTCTYLLPDGTEHLIEAEEGYTLLMASQTLPSQISTGRRAGGTCPDMGCGECRIHVLDDTGLSKMNDFEQGVLQAHAEGKVHEGRKRKPGPPIEADERLACHCRIQGHGGKVRVKAVVDYEALRGDPEGD